MTSRDEAAAALATMRLHRGRAVAGHFPVWFWPMLGAAMVVLSAGVESGRPALTAVSAGVTALLLAGAVVSVAVRQRVQVRGELLGEKGVLALVGSVFLLVAIGLGVGFGLDALDIAYPATIGNAVVAVALTAFGPPLTRTLQRHMADNARRSI